jgi:hypothetical protein
VTLLDGEMRARFLEDERYLRPPVRGKCSDRPNVRDEHQARLHPDTDGRTAAALSRLPVVRRSVRGSVGDVACGRPIIKHRACRRRVRRAGAGCYLHLTLFVTLEPGEVFVPMRYVRAS